MSASLIFPYTVTRWQPLNCVDQPKSNQNIWRKKVHSSNLFVMIYEHYSRFCETLYNEKQFLGQKCRRLQACLQETLSGRRPARGLMVNLRNLLERTVSVTLRHLTNTFGYGIMIGTYCMKSPVNVSS